MRLIPTSLTQRPIDPNNPTQGMTIDALRARQLALQKATPEAPAKIASPWQGAAYMASVFANSQQQKQAAAEEAAGRQKLAQTMAGINYDTGATPEQIAAMAQLDPDTSMKFISDVIQQRRMAAQQAHDEAMTRAGWEHQDEAQKAGFTHSDAAAAVQDERENQRAKAAREAAAASQQAAFEHSDQSQQAGFEHSDVAAATQDQREAERARVAREAAAAAQEANRQAENSEWGRRNTITNAQENTRVEGNRAYENTKPLTDVGRLDADLKAGRINQATYDDAISKMRPETYGKIVTGDEASALGLDPTMQWQQNLKTNKWEKPGGNGINIQTVPSEVGARVALGDDFLTNIDEVRRSADAGEMSGPLDFSSSVLLGRGSGGNAYRMLVQGSESLVRQLTGAGKSATEAQSQAQQFLPTFTDNAATLRSKVDGLERQLRATREGATAGRKFPVAPAAAASQLPEGVTEDDIKETMRANGMTRDQVLKRLGGVNGRP
jgi:hypothetical protein